MNLLCWVVKRRLLLWLPEKPAIRENMLPRVPTPLGISHRTNQGTGILLMEVLCLNGNELHGLTDQYLGATSLTVSPGPQRLQQGNDLE